FKDVQDFEFTIQDGKVYMLQTRNGKRTGVAAVKFACDMVREKLIDWKTAIKRVPADQLDQVLAPVFDRTALQSSAIENRCKDLIELIGRHALDRCFPVDQFFAHHVAGELHRRYAGAFSVARLQHVHLAVLDGELEVLHILE